MKIGFIGNSAFFGRIATSLQQTRHSVCGIYHSRKADLTRDIQEYPSAESLISSTDLVYVAKDDLPLFEISQIAIKEAKHLFFESPFLFDHESFQHLFHLAHESQSILRFGQKLLVHPVYSPVRTQLNPLFVSYRVDSPGGYETFDDVRNVLFDLVSTIWETVHSDLRKINYLPLEYNTQYPRTFFFDMDFDNGTHVNILFNHLAGEARVQTEFIQASQRFFLDFNRPKLLIHDEISGTSAPRLKKNKHEDEWIAEDFRDFVLSLKDSHPPLTINEDNQAVLTLTHSLLNEMHLKAQLLV